MGVFSQPFCQAIQPFCHLYPGCLLSATACAVCACTAMVRGTYALCAGRYVTFPDLGGRDDTRLPALHVQNLSVRLPRWTAAQTEPWVQ